MFLFQVPDSESSYDDESIGCSGSLKLGLWMDANLGVLTVSLKQANDLHAKRQVPVSPRSASFNGIIVWLGCSGKYLASAAIQRVDMK